MKFRFVNGGGEFLWKLWWEKAHEQRNRLHTDMKSVLVSLAAHAACIVKALTEPTSEKSCRTKAIFSSNFGVHINAQANPHRPQQKNAHPKGGVHQQSKYLFNYNLHELLFASLEDHFLSDIGFCIGRLEVGYFFSVYADSVLFDGSSCL